ncbi:MAG: VCBS repeat-containing protein [Chthoniobacter sp.]
MDVSSDHAQGQLGALHARARCRRCEWRWKADIIEAGGWWEHPASLAADPVWKHHAVNLGGGAQFYAYDVNGDGLPDIIGSVAAHGYGLAWWEQVRTGDEIRFRKHLIMGEKAEENRYGVHFSQLHALELADIDGDGLKDIVVGKRFWAHGTHGDPEPNEPAVLYGSSSSATARMSISSRTWSMTIPVSAPRWSSAM